ncbi:uncharacterized protein LOC132314020 [Cornus florida]|uniref:uncharacterized protein LOC132314020 n=1 Tax=Cornus florida TaxID=4283 RepID=UPI0028A2D844|nr:uncharacterized protein LOC132314020 [Cornus florida]
MLTQLQKRGGSEEPFCKFCGSEVESLDHILCTCPFACKVWKLSLLRLDFSNLSPSYWQKRWFSLTEIWKDGADSSACISLVAFICWSLWKSRNDLMFNNFLWEPFDVSKWAKLNFHDFREVRNQDALKSIPPPSLPPRPSRWVAPGFGSLKLNFDASFCSISKCCGGGVLLRNHLGHPIRVASFFLQNVCSPTVAEGLVLRESLTLLNMWGYSKVLVVGDCKSVMALHPSEEALSVILDDIPSLLFSCVGAFLVWTPRSGNVIAHLLSKKALAAKCCNFEWSIWPLWLLNACTSDYIMLSV